MKIYMYTFQKYGEIYDKEISSCSWKHLYIDVK